MIYSLCSKEYFEYEGYEDWNFGKEGEASINEYFAELDKYNQYETGAGKNIDFIGTALKSLNAGMNL